jgi:DNA-directed RNA polymerase subunit RPC12/RpoP
MFEIKCVKCGNQWYIDLAELDEKDQEIYRRLDEQTKTYRVTCPRCHTRNVLTIKIEGEPDA